MADGQIVAQGRFTSDGAAHDIVVRSDFDFFEVRNYTQAGLTPNPGVGVKFEWQRGFADNAAFMYTKQNSVNAIDLELITTGGFLRVDSSVQTPEGLKALSGTEIDRSNSEFTATSHGYSVGNRVRISGTTGMLQVGGYEGTITVVGDANTFTLGYWDMSAYTADATDGDVRRIPNPPQYRPDKNWIVLMTAADPMVVSLSVTHGLAIGDVVRLSVPAAFGMVEADGLQGKVTAVQAVAAGAVNTALNTVTLDIDASAFTAFALPTSANAGSPALLIPFGSQATNVDQALVNESEILMRLGAGADGPGGVNLDVMYWRALKAVSVDNL